MKTFFYCLAGGLIAASLAIAGFRLSSNISVGTLRKAPRASVTYLTSNEPSGAVRLGQSDHDKLAGCLSRYDGLIKNAEVMLDGRAPALAGPEEGQSVAYCLRLTLDNGVMLTSRKGRAGRGILGERLTECVRRCMRRYEELTAAGHEFQRCDNI
ncbi:hypothetical protein [Desulfocurvus sp. DL9XJH121]